jgi:protein-disulfide isomerase
VALLGALSNGILLILLLVGRFNMSDHTERTERYAFYLSAFIFLVSIFMGSVSAFILHSACPFCMSTYAFSLITLICLWLAYHPKLNYFTNDVIDLFTNQKWVLVAFLSIPALSYMVNDMTLDNYGYKEIQRVSEDSLSKWRSNPEQNFDLQNGLVFQKTQIEPKVVVVEFADFLCPHCRAAYPVLHSFAQSHPDVKLVFKSFPLDGACNTAIQHSGDGKRCDLAYATFCSEKLAQKGWQAHNYIFDNQEKIFSAPTDETIDGVCKATGIDCAQLKSCMNTNEIHEQVKHMASEGEKAQIGGTPAIFLNKRSLYGGQLLPVLESTYRALTK